MSWKHRIHLSPDGVAGLAQEVCSSDIVGYMLHNRTVFFHNQIMPELHKMAVRGLHIDHIAAVLILRAVNPDGLPQPPRLVLERRRSLGLFKDLRGNPPKIGVDFRPHPGSDFLNRDVHHDVIAHRSPPGTSAPAACPCCQAEARQCRIPCRRAQSACPPPRRAGSGS